ncbi:MAG: hypothetical protein ACOCP4_01940 [Candidatus Woesearchaeota archaeon]
MEIKFKHFILTNDSRSFIIKTINNGYEKNHYYVNFESVLNAMINKHMLKSEAKKIQGLIDELKEIKNDIKTLSKKWG